MTVKYQWKIERLDRSAYLCGSTHFPTLAEAKAATEVYPEGDIRIALVRDEYGANGDHDTRQHAFLNKRGQLPGTFDFGDSIPVRYRHEARKAAP